MWVGRQGHGRDRTPHPSGAVRCGLPSVEDMNPVDPISPALSAWHIVSSQMQRDSNGDMRIVKASRELPPDLGLPEEVRRALPPRLDGSTGSTVQA